MRRLRTAGMKLSTALMIVGLVLTGCTSNHDDLSYKSVPVTTTIPTKPSMQVEPGADYPQLGGAAPGSLLSAEPFELIDPRVTITGASAYRIRYMSLSWDDRPVEVTGVVLVPSGTPPEKGFELVAFNHGNTGIDSDCGPSLYDDLLNQWLPVSVLLLHGFAIVASDYEGLGGFGVHPFLDSKVLGRNVIDGVRAARHLSPLMGTRWAAFGGSLGGLATWAANEQVEAGYGDGLDLVGTAAWVPVVNVSELPAKAKAGTLTHDQLHMYFLAIMGLKRSSHPDIDLTQYIHGSMYENRDVLLLCSGPGVPKGMEVLAHADPADLIPASDEAMNQMQQWLAELAVPKRKAAAPMLVLYGSEDQLVDRPWIETALKESCAMGSTIQWVLRPGEGHGDINAEMAFPWVRSMFDGEKPINRCTAPFQA
ncbi:lipase family protein [Mycobacterium sp. ST-F2]|uniref:lipase family protein n=1 Tax=Mycobacterium sp. ST-F2 TaxID=1490484 RepID=UPI001153380E|nr:lipase family protein [Mycobacterium sp. ST-F2]